jgi:2-amino-4-hydroxy-6-hydroxymethyldihydropteridine diphosphokinase
VGTDVALGLGGNLGDPLQAFATALRALDDHPAITLGRYSSVYRTKPWGMVEQPDFLNMAALLSTDLDEVELLNVCVEFELASGRERGERWGPRTLDIDVLTFEGVAQAGGRLELPHPRMTERGFVLMPLADFAADMAVGGRPVGDWLQQADVAGIEVADGDMSWWRAGA